MKPFKKKKHIDSHSEVQKVLKGDWQKVFYVFYGQDPTKVSCLRRKEQQRHFSTLNLVFLMKTFCTTLPNSPTQTTPFSLKWHEEADRGNSSPVI